MEKWMGRFTLALLIVVLAAGIAFAGDFLVIRGLLGQELIVPLSLLETLPKETVDVIAVNSAGEESPFTAAGTLFSDLLAEYGKKQENILGIRLIAGDGYFVDVPSEVLLERQIILTYQIDGMPLDEGSAPLRVVIPGERAMYWVRNLSEIDVLDHVLDVDGE